MKRERILEMLLAAGLGWLLSASAVGCMVTGFGLEVAHETRLVLVCGGMAFLCAALFALRWGDVLVAGLFALTLGYLWHEGTVWDHISALLKFITERYNNAYGWGVFSLNGCATSGPVDLALGLIGFVTAVGVCWVMVRRRHVLWAVPGVVLPLISCLVVTDTAPRPLWLYLLLLGLVVLLMTDHGRRKTRRQTLKLTAYVAIPVAAALGALFLLVPQGSYVNQAAQYEERLVAWGRQVLHLAEETAQEVTTQITGQSPEESLDLSTVGPMDQWDFAVMEVTASESGRRYLRQQDYDVYSGTGWSASADRKEAFGGGPETGTLTIRTAGRFGRLYLPYFPAEGATLSGGQADNEEGLSEYTCLLTGYPGAHSVDRNRYTALPEETALWAETLASELTAGFGNTEYQAQSIAAYVRGSAAYSLDTPRMPGEETDFARWFLTESGTGYCVHFATASVVLLRAAGIPARYVTGYVADCVAGETVKVPERAAHAWAEYYDEDLGTWAVLEATPADAFAVAPAETEAPGTEPDRETAPDATKPAAPAETQPGPSAETPEKDPPAWLWPALWCLLALAALIGQSLLRQAILGHFWNRGTSNEQALSRWRQLSRLSRILPPPEELETLAAKARFSQHILTDRELAAFDDWRGEVLKQLRKRNVLQRLYWGLVHAIW